MSFSDLAYTVYFSAALYISLYVFVFECFCVRFMYVPCTTAQPCWRNNEDDDDDDDRLHAQSVALS